MRELVFSPSFEKKLQKFISFHPESRSVIGRIVDLLVKEPISVKYKSHKLSGSLKGCYAVSITKNYRLIYTYDTENIYLLNIGSHDDVY